MPLYFKGGHNFQSKRMHIANSNTVNYDIFHWLNRGFISCIHRVFALVANTKMCLILFQKHEKVWIFFLGRGEGGVGSIKFLGSELKSREGRVSRNTTFFLSLVIIVELWVICILNQKNLSINYIYIEISGVKTAYAISMFLHTSLQKLESGNWKLFIFSKFRRDNLIRPWPNSNLTRV